MEKGVFGGCGDTESEAGEVSVRKADDWFVEIYLCRELYIGSDFIRIIFSTSFTITFLFK